MSHFQCNIGTVKENPSTVPGVIGIMQNLSQHVPCDHHGEPVPILCNGDQLSVERMVQSKRSMASSGTAADALMGLIPCPQEFHRRCIGLQVQLMLRYIFNYIYIIYIQQPIVAINLFYASYRLLRWRMAYINITVNNSYTRHCVPVILNNKMYEKVDMYNFTHRIPWTSFTTLTVQGILERYTMWGTLSNTRPLKKKLWIMSTMWWTFWMYTHVEW